MRDKARRFRDAALPHLDDVYTLARYLLRNAADAEDAVQECYLRALRHFDTLSRAGDQAVAVRDPAQRLPRRIRARAARGADRGGGPTSRRGATPLWQEAAGTPEAEHAAPAGRANDPPAGRGAAGAVPRGDRAARDQRSVLSRDRRRRRRAGRHRDVAAGARARACCATAWKAERRSAHMTCEEAEILLHALLDGELDAGHARDVEAHVAACPRCAAAVARLSRQMRAGHGRPRTALCGAGELAPAHRGGAAGAAARARQPPRPAQGLCARHGALGRDGGELVVIVMRSDQDQRIARRGRVGASALAAGRSPHRRAASDQHTVKPWFNGQLESRRRWST